MSNPQSNPRAAAIFVVVSVLLAVTTLLLAFYLVPEKSRGLVFGLSVANLVIGEFFLGAELARAASAPRRSRVFVAALGGVMGPVIYLVAAAVLALIALAGLPQKLLVVLHALLFLAAVASLLVFMVAGEAAERATGGAAPTNSFLDDLKSSVRLLSDRATGLPTSASAAHAALKSLGEEIRFTYAGSDERSASDDAELRRELDAVDAALGLLQSNPSDPAASEAIIRACGRFKVVLARRNEGIKSRR